MSDERRELLVEIVRMLDDSELFDIVDLKDLIGLLKTHQRENVELQTTTGMKRTMRIGHYLLTDTVGAELSNGDVAFKQEAAAEEDA